MSDRLLMAVTIVRNVIRDADSPASLLLLLSSSSPVHDLLLSSLLLTYLIPFSQLSSRTMLTNMSSVFE